MLTTLVLQKQDLISLLQEVPEEVRDRIVQGVQETRFWTLCTKYYVGGVKLEVSTNCDAKYVVSHTQMIFRSVGVTQLYVQLDYEHNRATYQNLQNFAY